MCTENAVKPCDLRVGECRGPQKWGIGTSSLVIRSKDLCAIQKGKSPRRNDREKNFDQRWLSTASWSDRKEKLM